MLYLYCDGAIEPKNPGGHAVGAWVLKNEAGQVLGKGSHSYGSEPDVTNNIAEYGAVKSGIEQLIARGLVHAPITVRTDSELIVKQLNGVYACRNLVLREMRDAIYMMLEDFTDEVTFEWIPREENTEADTESRALYGTPLKYSIDWYEFDAVTHSRNAED